MTGFEIGGQVSHPWAKGIEVVEAGSVVRVRFPLEARLVPDAYFLNAGVLGLRDGGETYLHRILDAVLFRIEPQPASPVTGQVDLRAGDAPVEVEVVPPTGPSPRVAQGRPAG
jgi:lipopolysaccharide transport system ATP-binding protein